MKLSTISLALTLLILACGGQPFQGPASASRTAATSPSAPASEAPSGPFAVLATPPTSNSYTVSLVGADGHVAATAQASGFNGSLTCAGIANAVLPLPVSTSNARVYFMDGVGVVHWLDPQGQTAITATLPHGNGVRSMFAVSPDDKQMAVIVATFSATTEHATLYLYDLVAGRSVRVFDQTATSGLWPIGWHGGSLVVAKTPACSTGSAFDCCGPTELHVVDPVTAVRRFTIGGPACLVSGPSTPAGTPCLTSGNAARILDWVGVTQRTVQLPFQRYTYLSPDGQHLAYQTDGGTFFGGQNPLQMGVCGWIDSNTIIAGGDSQAQPRIGNITTGAITPIAALGECAGRIPGAL